MLNCPCEGMVYSGKSSDDSVEGSRAAAAAAAAARSDSSASSDEDSVTTRDLVLLYKNNEALGDARNDANAVRARRSNQRVESVVHVDDAPEPALCALCSAAALRDMCALSDEMLTCLNTHTINPFVPARAAFPSVSSAFTQNVGFKNDFLGPVAFAGAGPFLGDYSPIDGRLAGEHLEEGYIDNVIARAQNTITELQMISNVDHLLNRVREKYGIIKANHSNFKSKVLATSSDVPLDTMTKTARYLNPNAVVRSEMDVQSLNKLLEKKIIVEIPKLLSGTFRLYSQSIGDNLLIRCENEQKKVNSTNKESRVDVVLQLQRSQSGNDMTNCNSIIVLQSTPALSDLGRKDLPPLPYQQDVEEKTNHFDDLPIQIIELEKAAGDINEHKKGNYSENDTKKNDLENQSQSISYIKQLFSYDERMKECNKPTTMMQGMCRAAPKLSLRNEASFDLLSPGELRITMQRLHMQTPLPEETAEDTVSFSPPKRKSPIRVRIKSPYDNKSSLIEDKKRKKLLEVRERREKRKISQRKFITATVMPQPSSSVTKISITNKSFYNNIYGHARLCIDHSSRHKYRKRAKRSSPDDERHPEGVPSPPKGQKYTTSSDDDDTETAFPQTTNDDEEMSLPLEVSREPSAKFNLSLAFQDTPETNLPQDAFYDESQPERGKGSASIMELSHIKSSPAMDSIHNLAPMNSPDERTNFAEVSKIKKTVSNVECRKSTRNIYKIRENSIKSNITVDVVSAEKKQASVPSESHDGNSQVSDSGTSAKHGLVSSNPSCASLARPSNNNDHYKSSFTIFTNEPKAVPPKIVINSKKQTEVDKIKRERRKVVFSQPVRVTQDNPLKAISQILHEFNTVQKTRTKPVPETKPPKKDNLPYPFLNDGKTVTHPNKIPNKKRSQFDQLKEDVEKRGEIRTSPKDKRMRSETQSGGTKAAGHSISIDDKHVISKKKIADIIDEAKEARGEAVRGPSKFSSRLNALAQPKKSYVQAHSEQYQHRHGRNPLTERLQRLAHVASPTDKAATLLKSKPKKPERQPTQPEIMIKDPLKHTDSAVPLDLLMHRRPNSSNLTRNVPQPAQQRSRSSQALMSKMGAVENYLSSHYGTVSSTNELLLIGNKARPPFIPKDMDEMISVSLESSPCAEQATELGDNIHRIIDSMVEESPARAAAADNSSTVYSEESNVASNVLEDKNLETAVSGYRVDDFRKDSMIQVTGERSISNFQSSSFTAQLEKLENALCNQLTGPYHKKLRLKNLTLTPKHSTPHVFLLHSGDAGSLLVHSALSSTKLKERCKDNLTLKLSSPHVDWSFTPFPKQFATVGLSAPERPLPVCESRSEVIASTKSFSENCTSDKLEPYFPASPHIDYLDKCAQVNISNTIEVTAVVNLSLSSIPPLNTELYKEQSNQTELTSELLECREVNNHFDNKLSAIQEVASNVREESVITIYPMTASADGRPESMSTSSLDILVGLLTEIQKISYQNQIESQTHGDRQSRTGTALDVITEDTAKTETVDLNANLEVVSYETHESDPTLFSLFVANNKSQVKILKESVATVDEDVICEIFKPAGVDKEVHVNFHKEYKTACTDVPSIFFPIVVTHSTNISCHVGLMNEPSSYSLLSFAEDLPARRVSPLEHADVAADDIFVNDDETEFNDEYFESAFTFLNTINPSDAVSAHEQPLESDKLNDYVSDVGSHLDPMVKIKRDILVTVYSLLVLTVFAAFSIPDIIMFDA